MFDIHTHILPCVDDGSQSIEESIELLNLLKKQGVTDVLATPHFYPHEDSLEDFKERTSKAFAFLKNSIATMDLPNIYLGCEMLYFEGIGNSASLSEFCLNNSDMLLLELTDRCINNTLFKDIELICENSGITPLIAHVERYQKSKNYKKFLKFLEETNIPVQINADSLSNPFYNRTFKKLFNSKIFISIGTDCHSVNIRPPFMAKALDIIEKKYGTDISNKLISNSEQLFKKIVAKDEFM